MVKLNTMTTSEKWANSKFDPKRNGYRQASFDHTLGNNKQERSATTSGNLPFKKSDSLSRSRWRSTCHSLLQHRPTTEATNTNADSLFYPPRRGGDCNKHIYIQLRLW